MNGEGFGSNGAAFDYVIAREGKTRTRRRCLLILLYVTWVVLFFTAGVLSRLLLPLLCFIPLSVWILSFFTWRWSKEEINLSFLGGGITVARQFDGKNSKKLYEARLKNLRLVTDYTPKRMEGYLKNPKYRILYATKTDRLDGTVLAVWEDCVLVFESNEKALRAIKYYCNGKCYDVRGEKGAGSGIFGQGSNDWH